MLLVAGLRERAADRGGLREQLPAIEAGARDAAIEKFIAAKGGSPIIENQTRLVFFAKDKDGQTPRIVGDFNAWAATPQGYDVSIGTPTRIDGTSWSCLESTSYTNARLEYVLFFDKDACPDPLNPRTVQAFAGPRSEVRMPFLVAQPEVDELGLGPAGRADRRDGHLAVARRSTARLVLPAARLRRRPPTRCSRSSTSSTAPTTSRRWTCRACSIT